VIAAAWASAARLAASPLGKRLLPIGLAAAIWAGLAMGVLALRHHWISVGVDREKAAQGERLKAGKKIVAKVEAGGAAITAKAADQLKTTQTEIRWRTRVQLQEVTRYVPVESDRACIVGVGALRLHDHALAGLPGIPETAGGPLEAPSGVPLSALIADDVAFAGVAYDWRAEALTWRGWYTDHAALWKANIRTADKP